MNEAFVLFFTGMATSVGFNPALFAELITVFFTMIFVYFFVHTFKHNEIGFPVFVLFIVLEGLMGFVEWFDIVIPVILLSVFYYKTKEGKT